MRLTARTPSGLAYEAAGDGADVLLLHAGITDSRMWDGQWDVLAQRFHVVRFDARGFGASADPTRPYTLHGDAMEVLEALDIERAAVVGASMGGTTALDMAIALPHRVSALAIANSTPSGWRHSADILAAWDAVEAAYERDGLDAANELEMKMWMDGPSRSPGAIDRDVRLSVASVNRVLLERQEAMTIHPGDLDPPAVGRLSEVRCPALVISGELDQPNSISGSFEIARGIKAELVEIEDAAHLPNLEQPGEFNAALIEFLERELS